MWRASFPYRGSSSSSCSPQAAFPLAQLKNSSRCRLVHSGDREGDEEAWLLIQTHSYPGFLGQLKASPPTQVSLPPSSHPEADERRVRMCVYTRKCDRQGGSWLTLPPLPVAVHPDSATRGQSSQSQRDKVQQVGWKPVRANFLELPLTGGQEPARHLHGEGADLGSGPTEHLLWVWISAEGYSKVCVARPGRAKPLGQKARSEARGAAQTLGRPPQTHQTVARTGHQPCPLGDQLKELSTWSPPLMERGGQRREGGQRQPASLDSGRGTVANSPERRSGERSP